MNNLEIKLQEKDPNLFSEYSKSRKIISPLLEEFRINFQEFTDHSIKHSDTVSFYIAEMLNELEIENLNSDELYILLMACVLHDIGMTIPEDRVSEFISSKKIQKYLKDNSNKNIKDFIREFHHELSYLFIMREYLHLNIPTDRYAKAIALVSKAHREENLLDFNNYPPKFFVRSGSLFVCIPYLGVLIRIADELDITDERISELVLKLYYPKSKKSIVEFEKHRSNILVNFEGNIVKISAKCKDPHIYDTLIHMYKKIEEEIKDCQKVINNIKNLDKIKHTLTINTLENYIIPEGFVPKNIGFSFELKNIFNNFIGSNLYHNKMIAIREVLQNAIETCRYKQNCFPNYNPKIEVILNENKLIVEDNGKGMNEFIVSTFFSKLANSYYEIGDIKENFESVATFGIGVFSYFLICDNFEVNTRTLNDEPLHFKVFKNFDINFYFYDNQFIKEEGTRITFYLNEEITKLLNYQQLVDCIKRFIKDVEIPILITSNTSSILHSSDNYFLSFEDSTSQVIKKTRSNKVNSLELIGKSLNKRTYRGIIGIFLLKDESGNKTFNYIGNWMRGYKSSRIQISNKGIFVTKYTRGNILNYLFGRINILNKMKVNLSRNRIQSQEMVRNIVERFELAILYKISKNFKDSNEKANFIKVNKFFDNYIDKFHLSREFTKKFTKQYLTEILIIEVYNDPEYNYISLNKFLLTESKFILIGVSKNSFEIERKFDKNLQNIYNKYKIPIVLGHDRIFDYLYYLIRRKNYKLSLEFQTSGIVLFVFEITGDIVQVDYIKGIECVDFNHQYIFMHFSPSINLYNKNNPLINFWNENLEQINSDSLLTEIFDEIRLFLSRTSIHGYEPKFLDNINGYLQEVNNLFGVSLKIKKEDIPYKILFSSYYFSLVK